MRETAEVALPGTAVIYSGSALSDSQGGYTQAYAAAGTVDARLSPLTGSEAEAAGRVAEVGSWILTLPNGTLISEADRVLYDGTTYEVTAVLTRVPWEITRRVQLAEVA